MLEFKVTEEKTEQSSLPSTRCMASNEKRTKCIDKIVQNLWLFETPLEEMGLYKAHSSIRELP